MLRAPDIAALELLVAAVRHGSISAAARECGVTQQAASMRLRGLERQLGLELLLRTTRGVVPTAQGETVASWAEGVLTAAERFRSGVETLRGERTRELAVAASQTVAAHMIPSWLVAFRDRQLRAGAVPTTVRMVTGNSAEVETLVREGAVELGFIESSSLPSALSHTTVRMDELALVVAPTHEWSRRDAVTVEQAASCGMVAREAGSGTRRTWEDAVRRILKREPESPVVVLPTSAAVRAAVAEGLAPALLSRLAVADDIQLGRLVEVPMSEIIARPVSAVWRGGVRDLTPISRELVEVAVAAA